MSFFNTISNQEIHNSDNIGTLTNLQTTTKTNLVTALNEIDAMFEALNV